ncbi:transcription factor stalky-like isoform X2 [Pieris rapae]|uniref:transcription factor stalky-like isoform X2 n=1 Tax=Pieris rapae TaxID=64459 RepID=UPI001E27BF1C|nr:transcription factor stalky-like isoform X2 [Pieris rapae]
MESQGIQVNLLQDSENKKRYGPMKNKYSQCVCTGGILKSENETAKGFQTPIVVISVYPKESGSDGHMVRVEERQMSPMEKMEVQQKVSSKDKKSTSQRLASAKEVFSINKEYLREPNKSKMFKNNPKSVSPNRFSNSTRNHIPLGSSRTDVFSKRSKAKLSKTLYQSRQDTETSGGQKNLDTNRNLAKKALVDNYINKLETEEAKNNRAIAKHKYTAPKNKASKVTVNIDGESERYNLLFKHDRQNTDFSVRKTVKSKKNAHIASMENLLILTDDTKIPASGSLSYSANSPNPSKAEKNLDKRSSNLYVRDSIEVFHGRTSSGNSKQKMAEKNNSNPIENNYEGRAKHYRGDPCVIPDPSERDKEIRQLLGILTGRNLNEPKRNSRLSQETFVVKNCEECCIENECKKKVKLSSSLAKLFPQKLISKLQCKSKADLKHSETKYYELNDIVPIKTKLRTGDGQPTNCGVTEHDRLCTNHSNHSKSNNNVIYNNRNVESGNDANLILNRNINVFLEVEQFTKQKPIMLTRKQYNKVKRTIQNAVCKKFSNERRKANYYSSVTIGEVRIKSKFPRVLRLSKETQTDSIKNISSDMLSEKYIESKCSFNWDIDIEKKNELSESTTEENQNAQLLSKPRNIVSSMEVRYASVSLMKHVTYSSLACYNDNSIFVEQKDSNSIHTIFKGHKKSVTPNLGTSAYSLYSSNSNRTSLSQRSELIDSKKKPLLQRLVSCLIMRSKVSAIKIGKPPHKQPTKNSSINSYNINTSFAGVEIPSSLYDTSASFYSNHTIMPVYKMKRSFFSSVKGFLTHHRN